MRTFNAQQASAAPASQPVVRWLSAWRVSLLLDVSTRTLYRMVEQGQFPKPLRLSRKLTRWSEADVAAAMDAMMATRPGEVLIRDFTTGEEELYRPKCNGRAITHS